MKKLMIALALTASSVFAQDPATCPLHEQHAKEQQKSPYAGMEKRSVKALSDDQIADYRAGAGMGYGITGELNGYPGPKHVLELAASLGITAGQKQRLEDAKRSMHAVAARLGEEIVAKETQLDERFASGKVDANTLATMTEDIGRLQGRLRAVHLAAHLTTRAILTEDQMHRYAEARGYGHALHQ